MQWAGSVSAPRCLKSEEKLRFRKFLFPVLFAGMSPVQPPTPKWANGDRKVISTVQVSVKVFCFFSSSFQHKHTNVCLCPSPRSAEEIAVVQSVCPPPTNRIHAVPLRLSVCVCGILKRTSTQHPISVTCCFSTHTHTHRYRNVVSLLLPLVTEPVFGWKLKVKKEHNFCFLLSAAHVVETLAISVHLCSTSRTVFSCKESLALLMAMPVDEMIRGACQRLAPGLVTFLRFPKVSWRQGCAVCDLRDRGNLTTHDNTAASEDLRGFHSFQIVLNVNARKVRALVLFRSVSFEFRRSLPKKWYFSDLTLKVLQSGWFCHL